MIPTCSRVGELLFQCPHLSEWETEAQGGDRICKLVVELGMEGCSSWLLAPAVSSPLWLRLPLASLKEPKGIF